MSLYDGPCVWWIFSLVWPPQVRGVTTSQFTIQYTNVDESPTLQDARTVTWIAMLPDTVAHVGGLTFAVRTCDFCCHIELPLHHCYVLMAKYVFCRRKSSPTLKDGHLVKPIVLTSAPAAQPANRPYQLLSVNFPLALLSTLSRRFLHRYAVWSNMLLVVQMLSSFCMCC